ncbi:MAG: hypothetical protein WBM50_04485 [Acidimicrobiales bacterium]
MGRFELPTPCSQIVNDLLGDAGPIKPSRMMSFDYTKGSFQPL